MKFEPKSTRRNFIRSTALAGAATLLPGMAGWNLLASCGNKPSIPVYGHLWVYASQFPPDWNCTPILPTVFEDFQAAGLEGVELMESMLRAPSSVPLLKSFINQYDIPVVGTSYYGDMWDQSQQAYLLEDVERVVGHLSEVGGHIFGITVGDAGRLKTQKELDHQADMLQQIMRICKSHGVTPNLHNHTFEVENDLHDLKGTLERVPDIALGPDINWLMRAGVDPVWFIDTYGDRILYVHLRDQDASGRWTRSLGEGVTDFKAIYQALKRNNFSGEVAIELAFEEPVEGSVREHWVKSASFIEKVFRG